MPAVAVAAAKVLRCNVMLTFLKAILKRMAFLFPEFSFGNILKRSHCVSSQKLLLWVQCTQI